MHASPVYAARYLMPAYGLRLMIAHPRLGQPAIRRSGELFDVSWIAPALPSNGLQVSIESGPAVAIASPSCDGDGICHVAASTPVLPPGLYGVCVTLGQLGACAPRAL